MISFPKNQHVNIERTVPVKSINRLMIATIDRPALSRCPLGRQTRGSPPSASPISTILSTDDSSPGRVFHTLTLRPGILHKLNHRRGRVSGGPRDLTQRGSDSVHVHLSRLSTVFSPLRRPFAGPLPRVYRVFDRPSLFISILYRLGMSPCFYARVST